MNYSARRLNSLGFATCAGLMAFALYAQYGLNLEPCPLCILQRVAVIGMGVVFAVAAWHDGGRRSRIAYAVLLGLVGAAGLGVAGRHVWLQSLPPDRVPACGPGLDFMLEAFPLSEVLAMVLSGSGECAEISWSFLGLSMPAWVFAWLSALAVLGIWANVRRDPAAG